MWAANKPAIAETEAELLEMPRSVVIAPLNDKQITFCEEYTKTNNITLSAKRAGYSKKSLNIMAWKTRQNPECARYIAWLKVRVVNDCQLYAAELVDQYMKIAFADITDFVTVDRRGNVKLKDLEEIDGQIVTEIRQTGAGITIKLADKQKALEKLEQYFDTMPNDWKRKIEERKLNILEQRLELEKQKAGQFSEALSDDGFLEALKSTAEEIWSDSDDLIEE
jgi:phage terminase small subunit